MVCIEAVSRIPASTEYICTGLDLVITEEPCVMFATLPNTKNHPETPFDAVCDVAGGDRCSMAAVHSRFARVFFGVPNSSHSGGLGGDLDRNSKAIALQLTKQLNHRFEVYRGVLASECRALLDHCHSQKQQQ